MCFNSDVVNDIDIMIDATIEVSLFNNDLYIMKVQFVNEGRGNAWMRWDSSRPKPCKFTTQGSLYIGPLLI
jgi:hypothetical protein